ncbi:curli biogenesis system outer membrane secretion channel CsgG [Hydrogenispora ethanolica]|uniref:Curli biogenesis system outer membrane secretion channel CsgG n=1 Tax=Hydrogenispora ethanolica TaxID=1082276 RepID=A0A4R1SAD8_HYDET|nr:LPS assembly lipoprotein LptE [Hydrogenispora ethanolica]TCL76408.1 curli biogenesis system outer membrane secretion channel CsgG [Hydrogenispora ethanolica]
MRKARYLGMWVIFSALLAAGWLGLAAVPNYAESPQYTVAIVDFNNLSGKYLPNIGTAANEVLGTLLYQTDKFAVVERAKLASIMEEHHLSMSGLVNSESSALQIGKLLSADYLVTGSIVSYEQNVQRVQAYGITTEQITADITVNIKVLNVNTGKLEFAIFTPAQTKMLNTSGAANLSTGNTRELLSKALTAAVDKLVTRIEASQPKLPEKALVHFDSNPSGAEVEIDQVYYGNTPIAVPLNPGVHEVRISLAGYAPWIRMIHAAEGAIVSCTLEKKAK